MWRAVALPRWTLLHAGLRELLQHAFVEQVVVRLELIHLQQLGERDDVARVLVRVQVARLPQRPERVKDYLTRARKPPLEVFDGRLLLLLLLLLGADDQLTRDLSLQGEDMGGHRTLSSRPRRSSNKIG